MELRYKGERVCEAAFRSGVKRGTPCDRVAYYFQNGQYCCGTHSNGGRIELLENPRKAEVKTANDAAREEEIVDVMAENQRLRKVGLVIVTKLHSRKKPEHRTGYMSVFPNNKHGNRSDGMGLPALSPMRMGPIEHYCPGVGPATCLENFWQGSKQYVCESLESGDPSPEYFRTRNAMFLDSTPQRHKIVSNFKSGVKHSVWYDEFGTVHHLSYVESRQVYCVIYECFAEKTEELADLRESIQHGMNLNIIGYDGHDVFRYPGETLEDKFEAAYLDQSVPFGHEMCLQALLLLDFEARPWRKYHTINVFKP